MRVISPGMVWAPCCSSESWPLKVSKTDSIVCRRLPRLPKRATIPALAPLADLVAAGKPIPPKVRRDHALGPPEDCAPLAVFLASDEAADITGQAIGIGGDMLTVYAHPVEAAVEYRDGGWTAEEIAKAWADRLRKEKQPYTPNIPPLDLGADAEDAMLRATICA